MNKPGSSSRNELRIALVAAAIVFFFLLLAFRLWQVQLLQGAEHRRLTQRQSIRPVLLNPARGRIIASDGMVLADSISKYDLVAHLSEMRQPGRVGKTISYVLACERMLAASLGREAGLTEAKLKRHLYQHPVMPLLLFADLNAAELAKAAELSPPLPGLETVPRIERGYKLPAVATHLLGFTGKKLPQSDGLDEEFSRVYVSPELSGRSGLERRYDELLSGKAGARLLKVDSQGYVYEDLRQGLAPSHGNDLILSIDSHAQLAADAVLQGHKGALVAVAVHSGAVLALASSPTYNVAGLTQRRFQALLRDQEGRPLLNRAVDGMYTPGSIIKPLIALAALEQGLIQPEEEYFCSGRYMLGNHAIRCAKRSGHGWISLQEAVTYSCNPYFIELGIRVGIDRLQEYFKAAGFGQKTGIDLPESSQGIAPERDYALRHWQRNWLAVDSAYISIGQGAVMISPLQAVMFAAALANGGILYRPYLLDKVVSDSGETLLQSAPEIRQRLPLSAENLNLLKQAMHGAVSAPGGSAAALSQLDFELAAKTGTAEVGSGEQRRKDTWGICYGPLDNPEYAVACLIEDGDSGGKTAVPLIASFLKLWLQAGDGH